MALENFDSNNEEVKKGKKQIEEFLNRFPYKTKPELIDDLTPDQIYKIGSKNTFFYWVQYGTFAAGAIYLGGGTQVYENAKAKLTLFKRLLKKLLEYPVVIHDAGNRLQPNLVPNYLLDLGAVFHQFYTECRVLDESEQELTQNRLFLSECARQVFKNCLDLIGVNAPEKM